MQSTKTGEQLAIHLFGGPELVGPSGAMSLSPYQSAVVTAVFGVRPASLTRVQLAWLLWEADDEPRVRHRIRQLLHGMHRRVGSPLIVGEGDLLLPAPDVWVDVERFHDLIAEGSLLAAASLLVRGFAKGMDHFPSRELAEWRRGRELALGRRLRAAAAAAWEAHRAGADWEKARDAAEALYALAPGDERAIEQVIEARSRMGKAGSAEAAYSAYLDGLSAEAEPAPRLVDLIERVRTARAAEKAARGEATREVPFIGRRDALARGHSVLDRVLGGSFQFLLVTGESGIGKTRLLSELAKEASLRGIRALRAHPVELESRIPLNPLLDALQAVDLRPHLRALGEPWRSVVGSLLPPSATDGPPSEIPPIQESSIPRRLADAFFLLLERVANEQPTILFLDDLHWSDATTVTVLQFVQRRWYSGPLGIVAALRPELLTRDDAAQKYLLESDGLSIRRIALEELSEPESFQLIDRIVESPLDPETRRRLSDMGGRHPLYVTELTRDHAEGRLMLAPGLDSRDAQPLPAALRHIFDGRLRQLGQAAARIGTLLAVRARPMRLVELQSLTGLDLDQCADAADELARLRFAQIEGDSVGISHELFRVALYQSVSEAKRAVLHGAVAAHLVAQSESPSAGELALHYSRAGERELAARYARAAADAALASGALSDAATMLELLIGCDPKGLTLAEATHDLATVLHTSRQVSRAAPVLELATQRLTEAGLLESARRSDIRRLECLSDLQQLPGPAIAERLTAIKHDAREHDDWESIALALDVQLHVHHREADLAAVHATLEEMRGIAPVGSPIAACLCNAGLGMSVLFGGADDGLRRAEEAVAIARRHRLGNYLAWALSRLIVVLHYTGRLYLPASRALFDEARSAAQKSGDLFLRCILEANWGVFSLDVGEIDVAEEAFRRTEALLHGGDFRVIGFNQLINLGEIALIRGEVSTASAVFSRILSPQALPQQRQNALAGLGLCALEQGSLTEALNYSQRLAPFPHIWYDDPALILTFESQLLARQGKIAEALQVLRRHQPDLGRRLVPAWLKLRLAELRLSRRLSTHDFDERAIEARDAAAALCLTHRASQFEALMA